MESTLGWPAGKLVLGPLGRASFSGQVPPPFVPGLGLPVGELQSVLHLVATYAGLGGTWERACCQPRPAATSARLGTHLWATKCELRTASTCAGFASRLVEALSNPALATAYANLGDFWWELQCKLRQVAILARPG